MQNFLQDMLVGNLFAFLLIFMRFGLALMIMPGIGDSFVSPTIRLLFALALSFVVTPALAPHLPGIPSNTAVLLSLLVTEAFIGLFIGGIMRILVSALDTAGSIVSVQAGLSNAMLFNPATGGQGTVMSAVYSSLGVTLLMVTNLHHQMLAAVVSSYDLYPATGTLPDMGSVVRMAASVASVAFKVGVQMAAPFIVIGMLVQIGFGVLGRLMPQVQIFFLAMPLQIALTLALAFVTLSVSLLYWTESYQSVLFKSLVQ